MMKPNKEYLCKCLNCEIVMYDENPQTNAKKLLVPEGTEEMIQFRDVNGDIFWACPMCKTDAYLTDL